MPIQPAATRLTAVLLATLVAATGPSVPTLNAHTARKADGIAPPLLPRADARKRQRVHETRATMPLRFEPADVRGGDRAEFVARADGYAVALADANAQIAIIPTSGIGRTVIAVKLVGGSPTATADALELQSGVTNYLIGNSPSEWRSDVRGYSKIEYHDVYPGIDVVYYGNHQRLEYDFVVAPGASYRAIAIEFEGTTAVWIDRHGNLVMKTAAGDLVQRAPVIYQDVDGTRTPVSGGYIRLGEKRFGFRVGPYDPQRPLVIDPEVIYSTYLGGAREERGGGVAIDGEGNIYITGTTSSANFPLTAPFAHGRDNVDVFVVKLNAAGDQLLYATYLGGTASEEPTDVAVDSAGNAHVVGTTFSFDFPTVHAIQPSRRGINDSFVAKLDPTGAVIYSTYLGGNQDEAGEGIAVDRFGRAYIAGSTNSTDFPTVNAMQPSLGGNAVYRTTDGGRTWSGSGTSLRAGAVFTFGVDPTTSIVYAGADAVYKSTDNGATWSATSAGLPRLRVYAIAVAPDGTVYVGNDLGIYRSSDGGATWVDLHVGVGAIALVVDPASGSVYAAPSTLLGVLKSTDGGRTWNSIGLQSNVFSLAISQSVLYAGAFNGVFKNVGGSGWQATAAADGHTVIQNVSSLSVNPNNANQLYVGTSNGLFYSTTGGSAWTSAPVWAGARILGVAMAASAPSIVYVASQGGSRVTDDGGATWRPVGTGSAAYYFAVDPQVPTTAYEGTILTRNVFVSRISADGSSLEYSTYVGGSGGEGSSDIAVDGTGAAYVTGATQSVDFPTLNPFQANPGGLIDVFVVKLSEAGSLAYGTYLAGSESDYMPRIAVDTSSQAHVVGITLSSNFPTANAAQPSLGGFSDIFVSTLNAAGNGLVFSTFLGGSDQEVDGTLSLGPDVSIGPAGETNATGTTRSLDFPTRNAVQPAFAGGVTDAFDAQYDSMGRIRYSTYLGGTADDYGRRIADDSTGAAIVVGTTTSADFPTRDAFQATNAGGAEVFVARIDPGHALPDTTAPTTQISPSGSAGSNGWYRSAVQIVLSAADDLDGSGVAFIEYSLGDGPVQRYSGPFSIAAQGTTTVHARATDVAGNVENPGAMLALSIDSGVPSITIAAPAARDYLHSDQLQLSFAATDSVSGLAAANPTATLDGSAVSSGQRIQLLSVPLGTHTLVVSAADQAGNAATQTVVFRVKATIDSLIAAVNTFASQGQIDPSVAHSLQTKLSDAKRAMDRGSLSAARGKLSDFAAAVSAKNGSGIAVDAARVLLADVQYVLDTM
jgi:photosystem II stability/assembly factor-like uncharacterized protein